MGIERINNNLSGQALNNLNNLINTNLNRSFERLSSGLRINRAGDDASGLRIANLLRTQIAGLNEAFGQTQSAINLTNVADQGLQSVTDRLSRIRELTLQAGNTGVLDRNALQAIQSEISQNVDEINRVANTTQFGANNLLNGDFAPAAGVREGTNNRGVNIDSSTLTSEENFLNIEQITEGSARITADDPIGEPQVVNSGIGNQQDIAVTQGTFENAGTPAAGGDNLSNLTFNGVSIQNGGSISFSGVLADGETEFSTTVTVSAGSTVNDLVSSLQSAIDTAEQEAGVDTAAGTNAGETNVSFNATTGRIEFTNGAEEGVSNFNANITVRDAANDVQNTSQTTRAQEINGEATGAQAGNSVTAITGSTFETGDLELEVSNVTAAQRRTVENTIAFEDNAGNAAQTTTSLVGSVFNGETLAAGDTIDFTGTNADGTTFTNTITVSNVDTGVGNGDAATIQDLLDEVNNRDATALRGSGFTESTAQLTAGGRIQVTDDIAGESQTDFTITVTDRTAGGGTFGSIADSAEVTQEGAAESATVSINGGPQQRVEAGTTVTLFGEASGPNGENAPQITLTLGNNLSNGTDTIQNTRAQFQGSLNNGPQVQFSAGQQDVRFVSGLNNEESLTVDFDPNVDVNENGQGSVVISATGRQANFQVGANADQSIGLSFGDVRSSQLGLGEGRSLEDIDITEPGGVDEALRIIDAALGQVDDIRGGVGATANRLQASANSLSVASENLLASQSRIQDTDFARQSSELIRDQLLLQSNLGVQSQINDLRSVLFLDLLR